MTSNPTTRWPPDRGGARPRSRRCHSAVIAPDPVTGPVPGDRDPTRDHRLLFRGCGAAHGQPRLRDRDSREADGRIEAGSLRPCRAGRAPTPRSSESTSVDYSGELGRCTEALRRENGQPRGSTESRSSTRLAAICWLSSGPRRRLGRRVPLRSSCRVQPVDARSPPRGSPADRGDVGSP